MARYRQPQLPGLPLFLPKRRKKSKKVLKQGGEVFPLHRRRAAPLGISILANQISTAKLNRARRRG